MGEKYKPVAGDRVRVVLEGEVGPDATGHFYVGAPGEGNSIKAEVGHVVSIEKIEPPVEVFGPGDVVRPIGDPSNVFALGYRQYLAIGKANGTARAWTYEGSEFTSDEYELVYRP